MKSSLLKLAFLSLSLLGPFAATSAEAYGGDMVARAVTHQSPAEILQFVIGAIVGAALLAGAAYFAFSPQPSNIVLAGLALAGATGMIHLMIGLVWGDTLFLLNGVGYFGLAIFWALPNELFPRQKMLTAWALALYTFVTIVAFIVSHLGDHFDFLGIFDKVIEVGLLIAIGVSVFGPESASGRATA